MREIKFRAWQKQPSLNRKPGMYPVESIVWYDRPMITEDEGERIINTGEVFFGEPYSHNNSEFLEDVELMQYTGLKDKNGKEIYEGDIVVADGIKQVIKYSPPCFSFLVDDEGEVKPCEVIGNIYENPELLS